jgi:hypothetical protein
MPLLTELENPFLVGFYTYFAPTTLGFRLRTTHHASRYTAPA